MKFLYLFFALFLIASCNTETDVTSEEEKDSTQAVLEDKIAELEAELMQKDSAFSQALRFFTAIEANLAQITQKSNTIRIKSGNPEITPEDQEWIITEIQNINNLREQNARDVNRLKKELASQNISIVGLNDMIDNLSEQIKEKDEQIDLLQNELANINMEYAALFEEYKNQLDQADQLIEEMNAVFYAYGTLKELKQNNVMTNRNTLADNFNEKYFQKIDKTKIRTISVVGKKPKILTPQPESSYEWNETTLTIKDAESFWKTSSYLVIQVK